MSFQYHERVVDIPKTMIAGINILETMEAFGVEAAPASWIKPVVYGWGVLREGEILCGHRSTHMVKAHVDNQEYVYRLKQRIKEFRLWDCFCRYLQKNGYDIQTPDRRNDNGLIYDPSPHNQQILLDIMKNDQEKALLCELLVDFDEGMQEWRYRYVKMVERTICDKAGKGGSSGVDYLRRTCIGAFSLTFGRYDQKSSILIIKYV